MWLGPPTTTIANLSPPGALALVLPVSLMHTSAHAVLDRMALEYLDLTNKDRIVVDPRSGLRFFATACADVLCSRRLNWGGVLSRSGAQALLSAAGNKLPSVYRFGEVTRGSERLR